MADLSKLTREELIIKLGMSNAAYYTELKRRYEIEDKIAKLRDILVDLLSDEFVRKCDLYNTGE